MNSLQLEIKKFHERTFPDAVPKVTIKHLQREMNELRDAIDKDDLSNICEEIADCMIILYGLSNLYKIDAEKEIIKKHENNLKRKWKQPDSEGVIEHEK